MADKVRDLVKCRFPSGKSRTENARLTFDHVVNELLQGMIDGHFKFYKQVNDDPEFAKTFLDWLFEHYLFRSKKS